MNPTSEIGILTFAPALFERVWGGARLREMYGMPPGELPVGEAWLIADHPAHSSIIIRGRFRNATLHEIVAAHPLPLLGARPQPARGGRFPLMLKLIDAAEMLSVQVHPDDETAARLGEADGGKNEMWYILDARERAQVYCGFQTEANHITLESAIRDMALEPLLRKCPVSPGDALLLPARTIHALGGGILLAEIQQTSDVTYRVYDWGRVGLDGEPRPIHIRESLGALDFGPPRYLPQRGLLVEGNGAQRSILASCPFFTAEKLRCRERYRRESHRDSFHVLLCIDGVVEIGTHDDGCTLERTHAALIPGDYEWFDVSGKGEIVDYYVANPEDILRSLAGAGHRSSEIRGIGPVM